MKMVLLKTIAKKNCPKFIIQKSKELEIKWVSIIRSKSNKKIQNKIPKNIENFLMG